MHVIGLFENTSQADGAIRDLVNAGIDRDHISLISKDSSNQRRPNDPQEEGMSGAAKGAGVGAAIGGVGGLLAGLASLAIPGLGPLIAAGPLAAALGGALGGAGLGAAAGGLIGALTDLGVPEEEAKWYAEGVQSGGTLVTVRTDDEETAERAADIMRRHSATDVDQRGAVSRTELSEGERSVRSNDQDRIKVPSAASRTELSEGERSVQSNDRDRIKIPSAVSRTELSEGERSVQNNQGNIKIPVTEERLRVGKETVQTGGIRIYGRIREKPVEESVQLREERVKVERHPVDRPVTAGDKFEERVIEVTESRERPIVGKEERVVEEIEISKEAHERTETIRDTVRRKDVEIEAHNEEKR